MAVLLTNNATSRLAATLTTVAGGLSVAAGEGARFPSPSGGDWFPVTIIKTSGAFEIVRCVGRAGDVLAIARAQDGTAAQSFSVGDRVELRLTVGALSEFAQVSKAQDWPGRQKFLSGLDSGETIGLSNQSADSPDLFFQTPSWRAMLDVANNVFRVYSQGGNGLQFPLQLDLLNQVATMWGGVVWTSGNFNPGNYLPVNGKAADANLLDGIDSSGFVRLGVNNPIAPGTQLVSGSPPSIPAITDGQAALALSNGGNTAASVVMNFRREGQFAAYFGIDTDNRWKVGGGSMGPIAYDLWHDGNGINKAIGAQAAASAGGVGTYALLLNRSGASIINASVNAGSGLRFAGTSQVTGQTVPAGSWRAMGDAVNNEATLFVRVS